MLANRIFALVVIVCVSLSVTAADFPISKKTSQAGTQVTRGGQTVALYPGSLKVGESLLKSAEKLGLDLKGQVSVVSVVPSVDTKVCEQQTHILGENKLLSPKVNRITISRDLPMAQSRFAENAKLTNIKYFSDYKTGAFGQDTGLLMKGNELLARAVMVVDQKGVVRFLQVVPELGHLPDMEAAFKKANELVGK